MTLISLQIVLFGKFNLRIKRIELSRRTKQRMNSCLFYFSLLVS